MSRMGKRKLEYFSLTCDMVPWSRNEFWRWSKGYVTIGYSLFLVPEILMFIGVVLCLLDPDEVRCINLTTSCEGHGTQKVLKRSMMGSGFRSPALMREHSEFRANTLGHPSSSNLSAVVVKNTYMRKWIVSRGQEQRAARNLFAVANWAPAIRKAFTNNDKEAVPWDASMQYHV